MRRHKLMRKYIVVFVPPPSEGSQGLRSSQVKRPAWPVGPLVSTCGVERRAEFSPLGPRAGCFLALGSGVGLVGTVSARRSKRAKTGKNGENLGEIWSKKCEGRRGRRDHLGGEVGNPCLVQDRAEPRVPGGQTLPAPNASSLLPLLFGRFPTIALLRTFGSRKPGKSKANGGKSVGALAVWWPRSVVAIAHRRAYLARRPASVRRPGRGH